MKKFTAVLLCITLVFSCLLTSYATEETHKINASPSGSFLAENVGTMTNYVKNYVITGYDNPNASSESTIPVYVAEKTTTITNYNSKPYIGFGVYISPEVSISYYEGANSMPIELDEEDRPDWTKSKYSASYFQDSKTFEPGSYLIEFIEKNCKGNMSNVVGRSYKKIILIVTENEVFPDVEFTDVDPSSWYYDAVKWAFAKGVTSGKSKTSFAPDDSCTRGQVVTFLWNSMGRPEPVSTENPFTDVSETDYFYKPVLWAVENKITAGTSTTTFSPSKNCSYAHILTFIYNSVGKPDFTGEGLYYTDAFNWAEKNGYLENTYVEPFSANADCPRSSTIQYLYKYYLSK